MPDLITDYADFIEQPVSDTTEHLYRVDGHAYTDGSVQVSTYSYPITGTTPKGVWVDVFGDKKFVLSAAKKRFAYPTEDEALQSFLARKKRQRIILRDQLQRVERLIAEAKRQQASTVPEVRS